MSETEEVYNELFVDEVKGIHFRRMGIEFFTDQINIYPGTGCICLKKDGTWAGDIAPFCD